MRWLGNEAQDGDDRPCQNSGLPPRKHRYHLAPLNESLFHFPGAVKEIVETLREGARTSRRLDRIAQRHLLERKKQICSSFNRDRLCRALAVFPGCQQLSKACLIKRLSPLLMCGPLVPALPIFIERIAKSLRKIMEKLTAAVSRARRQRDPPVSVESFTAIEGGGPLSRLP